MKGRKLSKECRTNRSVWHYRLTNINTNEVIETDSLNMLCEEKGWSRNSINEAVCRKRNKYKEWKIERWTK